MDTISGWPSFFLPFSRRSYPLLLGKNRPMPAEVLHLWPSYFTSPRHENEESACSVVQSGRTPMQPYEHTVRWRSDGLGRNVSTMRVRSRLLMKYAG
jgi:hypothetical protein